MWAAGQGRAWAEPQEIAGMGPFLTRKTSHFKGGCLMITFNFSAIWRGIMSVSPLSDEEMEKSLTPNRTLVKDRVRCVCRVLNPGPAQTHHTKPFYINIQTIRNSFTRNVLPGKGQLHRPAALMLALSAGKGGACLPPSSRPRTSLI